MNSEIKERTCTLCKETKELHNFYKKIVITGLPYNSRCKQCLRGLYAEYRKTKDKPQPKPTGFNKFSEELQKIIIYEVHNGLNCLAICKKYKKLYPNLVYGTLNYIQRCGKIPVYNEEDFKDYKLPEVHEEKEDKIEPTVIETVKYKDITFNVVEDDDIYMLCTIIKQLGKKLPDDYVFTDEEKGVMLYERYYTMTGNRRKYPKRY